MHGHERVNVLFSRENDIEMKAFWPNLSKLRTHDVLHSKLLRVLLRHHRFVHDLPIEVVPQFLIITFSLAADHFDHEWPERLRRFLVKLSAVGGFEEGCSRSKHGRDRTYTSNDFFWHPFEQCHGGYTCCSSVQKVAMNEKSFTFESFLVVKNLIQEVSYKQWFYILACFLRCMPVRE